jgi:hypothetical protein
MASGDKLTLGDLQNSAESMTRLVANVAGNYVFRVDQGSAASGAIMGLGQIAGFGLNSTSQPGQVALQFT